MSKTVAMYDKSYAHIAPRLDALGLDINVLTFGRDGKFSKDGQKVAPQDVAVDYVWLSTHLNNDGFRDEAFDMVLNCKSVGVVQTFNAGLDHPIYKKLAQKGVRSATAVRRALPSPSMSFGKVLSVLQPIEQQRALQAAKQWKITPFREISQTRWLIVGFGPIGEQLALRVKAFGAAVDVVRRTASPSPLADRVGTMDNVMTYAADADIVVLACSLTDVTRGFADAAFFAAMKPGAILVNIARGALIDDAAMLAALDSGHLGTAILDVFHTEPLPASDSLWTHPKVRMTGHTSFSGSGVRARWDELFLDNIVRFARDEPLRRVVDPRDIL